MIEYNVGDAVHVHLRNADERRRLVTKAIKITTAFFGEIEFPFPVLELLPVHGADSRKVALHSARAWL